MARADFGGTSSDFVYTKTAGGLLRLVATTVTLWTAEFAGTQITDLIVNGGAASSVSVDADGQIPTFQGPDGVYEMWASAGGGDRVLLTSVADQVSDSVGAAIAAKDAAEDARDDAQTAAASVPGLLASKANVASPTFTGTVSGVTKTHVGLGNVENLSPAGLAADPALSAAFAPRPARVADLSRPFALPHRGAGANLAPENTKEAILIGASYGLGIAEGGDWRVTSDGALFCMHDDTLDRTTTRTGAVSALTSIGARQVVVDAGSWFGGIFGNLTSPSAEDIYGSLGGSFVLTPEPKTEAAAYMLADLIERLGLEASVLPNTFAATAAWMDPFLDIGCTDVLLNITTMPTSGERATWLASGIRWLGIPYNGAITTADVVTLTDEGFEIMVGTIWRASHVTPWASVLDRISAWASDDPLYTAHAYDPAQVQHRRSTDPFASQTYYHGHTPFTVSMSFNPAYRGTFLGGNRWGYQQSITTYGKAWNLQGWACPLPTPTAQTIAFDLTFDALGSSSTRWGGIFACMPTDERYFDAGETQESGYQGWLTRAGSLNLAEKTAGVTGTPATPAATAAVSAPLTTSSDLTAGVAVTAIAVTAIPTALASGARLALPTGQIATLSGAASAGVTSVAVTSITPTATVASGTSLPQSVPLTLVITPTTITLNRLDTAHSISLTDSTSRGPYFHFGCSDQITTGFRCSFSNVVVS